MSKTITIHRNDGTDFVQAVDKLRTPATGGGSITWVPEEDTRCEELRVTANGTYNAEARGKYGYDYVTVSVPGNSVTGKDPETGKETIVTKDPISGELEKTVAPVAIRVITRPYKVTYLDGEPIVYSGIVVKAYDSDGEELLTCPYSELVFPTRYAEYDGETAIYTDGAGVAAGIYNTGADLEPVGIWGNFYVGDHVGECVDGQFAGYSVCLGETPGTGGNHTVYATIYNGRQYYRLSADSDANGILLQNIFIAGKPKVNGTIGEIYKHRWTEIAQKKVKYNYPQSTKSPVEAGEMYFESTQELPVEWARPGDGVVLTTSFDVSVSPQTT